VLGHRVRWLEGGQGPVVMVLPSPLVMAGTYRPLLSRLATRFRVFALELPGAGFSAEPSRPLTTDEHAAVALAFLDGRGVDRAVWVGHSNSGPVAVAAALARPDRVAELVLVDPIGGLPHDSLWRLLFARFIEGLFEVRVSLRGLPHLLWNLLRHPRTVRAQVRLALSTDLRPALAALEIPVRLAWGARDRTAPLGAAHALAGSTVQARLTLVEGRHDWLIEHPDRAVDLIADLV
jgi:pimeloyl-ACP methyl ester carboxylesterase